MSHNDEVIDLMNRLAAEKARADAGAGDGIDFNHVERRLREEAATGLDGSPGNALAVKTLRAYLAIRKEIEGLRVALAEKDREIAELKAELEDGCSDCYDLKPAIVAEKARADAAEEFVEIASKFVDDTFHKDGCQPSTYEHESVERCVCGKSLLEIKARAILASREEAKR